MDRSLLGNLALVFGVSLMLAYTAMQTCDRVPALSMWMGGICGTYEEVQKTSEEGAHHHTAVHFFGGESGYFDAEVSKAAVYQLAESGTDGALEALIALIHSDAPVELRKAAVYALGQSAGGDAIDELTRIAASDAPVELRKASIHALEGLGSVDALLNVLDEVLQNREAL